MHAGEPGKEVLHIETDLAGRWIVRAPFPEDGQRIWKLVRDAGTLDLNSAYCYILLSDLFRDTCVVAEINGEVAGALTAFRKPAEPDTLFVWQVAVGKAYRGKGLAKAMFKHLTAREACRGVRYVEATIGPGNAASRALFIGMANEWEAPCRIAEQYGSGLFPDSEKHEDELQFRIGPIERFETNIAWS